MRVLHVTHQYFPAIGGSEKYITDISEELARKGHRIDVFTSRSRDFHTWANTLEPNEVRSGVNVRRFRSLPRTSLTWKLLSYGVNQYRRTHRRYFQPLIWYGNGPVCAGMFFAILSAGRRYDLIHISQLHYAHSWLAAKAARWAGIPVVLTPLVHAEQPVTYEFPYLQSVMDTSDVIIAITESEREFLAERNRNREVVLTGTGLRISEYPPLDPVASRRSLGLRDSEFVVLFLGRKGLYKGLDKTIDAVRELRNKGMSVHLLAVGPETEFSRKLWKEHGDTPWITVKDAVTHDEKLAVLAACDVLALPSTGESFGIVYLEAWAYEKSVIGARINAVSSLIDHGTDGLLCEPDSVQSVYENLNCLIQDSELRKRLGANGRDKLERRYTIERIGDIVEGTYARLLRRGRQMQAARG
ncbi:MAG: glycosyltransferase family 4 protein [Gammaproteobacteria bacterium]|nr:glycosyltransferase family 4 protein [Gammaproteobacteria bacterium]MDH3465440.1 glycosyltransferase family 4 protein [Gammaproteobacteria bacterium]